MGRARDVGVLEGNASYNLDGTQSKYFAISFLIN